MRPGLKLTIRLFLCGMKQIVKDGLLLMLLPAPFIVGLTFKYAVPFASGIAATRIQFSLRPWYGLMDGFLICLTPLFVAMSSAFLLLEEQDEGICAYYWITPTESCTYLLARMGLPMVGAFGITVVVMILFGMSGLSVSSIAAGSVISSLTGISLAMMVVSLAGNRVEGLALSKLMGVSLLGLFLVWFIPAPFCYLAAFLPSFWIGRLLMDGSSLFIVSVGICLCFGWIALFTRRFFKKIGTGR